MRSFMIKFNQYSSDNRIFNLINFYVILLVCGVSCLCCCNISLKNSAKDICINGGVSEILVSQKYFSNLLYYFCTVLFDKV